MGYAGTSAGIVLDMVKEAAAAKETKDNADRVGFRRFTLHIKHGWAKRVVAEGLQFRDETCAVHWLDDGHKAFYDKTPFPDVDFDFEWVDK